MKTTTITKAEWEDYYKVQRSGKINMMSHWNIVKFATGDNYPKARKHFKDDKNETDLVLHYPIENKKTYWPN
jgi:hypothetical protein